MFDKPFFQNYSILTEDIDIQFTDIFQWKSAKKRVKWVQSKV